MNPPATRPKVTEEGQAAAARIAEARQNVNNGATPAEARATVRQIERGGQVITPENLTPTPQVQVTPPATPTVSPQLQADLEVQTDEFTNNLTAQREQAEKGRGTALSEYLSTVRGMSTPSQLQADALEETGANAASLELNDINDQIRREQLSNRRAKERILEAGGQSKARAQAQIANLDRASLSKQADLSVIQQAVQGRYDSAREIADRAVQARLEHQQLMTEAAKFNYEENKQLFTVAEQREFETLLGNRERAIQTEADKLKTIQNLALQAMQDGAPRDVVSQMQKATTVEQATSIGGQYIGALDRQAKQAQIANIYDQINARNTAARGAELEAATEEEKIQAKKTADAEQALSIKQLAEQIKQQEGLSAAVGFGLKKSVVGSIPFMSGDAVSGTDRADFEAQATRLGNLLTLDNLKLMTGVLTDRDIQLLATAGSNLLNFNQSEDSYLKEIDRIVNTMNRTITNNGVTPEQAVFYGLIDESDAASLDAIWNNL